jgi:hypothetical protein
MRVPHNTLKKLQKETGFRTQYLCDVIARRKKVGNARAIALSEASERIGRNISPGMWAFGETDDIKRRLGAE